MIKVRNYEDAFTLADGQLTAQELLNGNMKVVNVGWTKVSLEEDFRKQFINDLADVFGGHLKTKIAVKSTLTYSKPQHWGLDRTVVVKYGEGPAKLHYIAGQDQVWETNEIRKALK